MKTYKGHKDSRFNHQLVFVLRSEKPRMPYPLRQAWKDDAIGFNWGYAGASHDHLALSILVDFFGTEDIHRDVCKQFKTDFLHNAGPELKITEEQIIDWIANRVWKLIIKHHGGHLGKA